MSKRNIIKTRRGQAWRKYIHIYPYLLSYELNETYPYKELADFFGVEVVVIRHMVNWMQRKPEVVALLRAQYTPEVLPDWVGQFEGEVDLVEYLRSKGIKLPLDGGGSAEDDDPEQL
jgi:hypothetical protein